MLKNWNWTKSEEQNKQRNAPMAQNTRNAIAPYFGPLAGFYQDVDRVLDQTFGNLSLPSIFGGNALQGMMFNPKVDISSTDKEYTIEVEVPGMSENDIRLDVTRDGDLCICGEKRLENDKQEKDFHRVERSYGSFSRTLSLPDDMDSENIEANFNNGVLTITAPRMEGQNAESRRIEVKAGESANGKRERPESIKQDNVHPHPKRGGSAQG